MQAFIVAVLIKALSDERVQKIIKDLLGQLIAERIAPLIPVAAGAFAKAITEQLPEAATASVEHVADAVREELNTVIPNLGIPGLDQIIDMWRPK